MDSFLSGGTLSNKALGESLLGSGEKALSPHDDHPSWVDEEAAPLATANNGSNGRPMGSLDPSNAATAGEAQPRRFRDAWAALLFLFQQGVLLYLALAWGWPAVHKTNSNAAQSSGIAATGSYSATFSLLFSVATLSLLTGALLLTGITRIVEQLLQGALLVTAAANALIAVWLLANGYWVASLLPLALWLITGLYARAVWHRIPLAATHLRISLQAVQQNPSLVLVALAMTTALMLWMAVWLLAFCGIYMRSLSLQDGQVHVNGLVLVWLILSLYWTIQVSRNIVHVTVSGTVGTFWFCPDEANRFASPAVRDSWYRSLTYSLGSICLGSLLAALLQLLHALAHAARRQHQQRHSTAAAAASVLWCVVECLARCTERLLTYFNKW